MEVIPAVDIKNGRCVRLLRGDFGREFVYFADPLEAAKLWEAEGAERLHLVDLDGAASGRPQNLRAIERITRRTRLKVQIGGGIRSLEVIEELLDLGADRVILGTRAIEDPDFLKRACSEFGPRIAVSVDVEGGKVRIRGWREAALPSPEEIIRRAEECGVGLFIFTDIRRDGTLQGPDISSAARFIASATKPVLVAGGISKLEHIRALRDVGACGVIIGRALYTGDIKLKDALREFGGGDARREDREDQIR